MEVFLKWLILIISIVLTFVVAIQSSKAEGLGSIGGGANLFFAKNKGFEDFLDRVTLGAAVGFGFLIILWWVLSKTIFQS